MTTRFRGEGSIELHENGQFTITPDSTLKAVSSILQLNSNADAYTISATLTVEILYHCSLCGAKNMNYETSEFHKQTMEHLVTLQKSLECYETITECLDMETDRSVTSSSPPPSVQMIEDEPTSIKDDDERTVTDCDPQEVQSPPKIIIDAVNEDNVLVETPQPSTDVVVVPPGAHVKPKRKCSFVEEPDVSEEDDDDSKFDKPMERDGNCLFRSFADQIYGDEMYHLLLRHICYHYLQEHPELGYDLGYNESQVAEAIEKGFKFGWWAGEMETKVISEIYHFRIETIDKVTKSVIQCFGELNWATLRVVFSNEENHYTSYIAISNSAGNFSDVFKPSHFDNPGSFENDLLGDLEGVVLPEMEKKYFRFRKIKALFNPLDIFEISPKSLGLYHFTGKYEACIIDTAFAFPEMLMNSENFHLPSDDTTGDMIYYKLRVEDCDVIWCSFNYLSKRKKVFKDQKRSGRKRRRTWKQSQ